MHPTYCAAVSFDGACTLWEPDVAGDAQAAAEEAAAFAEAQQPVSAGRGGGGGGRGALPTPLGDQYAW